MDINTVIAFHKAQLAIHEANNQLELAESTRELLVQLTYSKRVGDEQLAAEKAYIATLPLAEVVE